MHIQEHVELKKYSTFHIGGAADFFVEVVSKEELREAVMWAEEHGQSWCVVGEGSNILFPDEGVRGLIIKNSILGIVHETTEAGISLTVGAGVILDDLVSYACDHGWWGLENLSSIPGTVGATPVQNVGAYGLEVAEVISSVSVYDSEADSYLVLFPSECRFGYRNSLFKEREGKRYVIHTVSFFLKKETGPCLTYRDLVPLLGAQETLTPHVVRKEVIRIRSQKFPNWHMLGTAGSFFKNPTVSDEAFKELSLKYP